MSPLALRSRLRFEAGRLAFGLWLIVMSLFAAPQLNSWLDRQHPGHPGFLLAGAIGLAVVACTGLTLVMTAVLRSLTALVANAGHSAN
jgi:hypothetical protein